MNRKLIAKRLIKLRGKRTQIELAKAIGVSQSTYAMYETAQRLPSDERKIAIAKFYRLTVQDIFFNEKSHL